MIRHFFSYQVAINSLHLEGFWASTPTLFLKNDVYASIHEITGTPHVMVAYARLE